MQVTVKGKHFDVTEALKVYANEKVTKISRYFDHVISADVTLSTERNWHIAEVTVFGQGFDMRGEERTKDMYNSIDRVIDKLERQIKKQKGKVVARRPSRSGGGAAPEVEAAPATPKKKAEAEVDRYAPRVDHVNSYLAEPMTIEEAIKDMEAHGHEFLAFLNVECDRINVVYKRERGYGLIDPRIEEAE
ncbi:MAG: ribosome-associated translation inhibitor RaiA [Candidatus Eremiobacteraeota bacterium]|nr:ribosome-associated translation inhibitor RaiA [Candidatus Eremiobacteraeota bacterium]